MKPKIWMKLILPIVIIAVLAGITVNDCIREMPGTGITAGAVNPITFGDYQYFINENGTVTIARYLGYDTEIAVPSVIDGRKVTVIGQSAFQNRSVLTKVVIPNGIISVEKDAFMDCTSLKNLDIPESVESLKTPFGFCYSLKSINVSPDNKHYTSEDGIVFDKVKKRIICYPPGKTNESYTIPDSVESIAESAFATCRRLTSVSFQGSLVEIGNSAFENCSSITSIAVPDSVGTIGSSAFEGCTSLKSVVLPQNIESLSYRLFSGCSGLTSITLPDSLSSVDGAVFYGCSKLKNIVIPESVSSLGVGIFYNCTSLEKIVIPSKITGIPDRTFSGCTSLSDISFSENIVSVGSSAFKECSALKTVILPDSLTYIGNNAFYGCSGLTRLNIPKNVNVIDNGAFSHCTGLTEMTVPQGVASINDWTFSYCSNLTKVSIPDSVTSIGGAAFERCSNLAGIVIPGSVVSVGYGAFYYCTALTDVVIPHGVTSVGHNAFANCTNLAGISVSDTVSSIGEYAFAYCPNLTNISVSDGNLNYASENGVLFNKNKTKLLVCPCGKQGEYTIPDGVTAVESYAFAYCVGLTHITVPDSVASIKTDSLAGCDNLTLCGNSNSYAAAYAAENHIPFVAIDLISEQKSVSFLTVTLSATSFTYSGTPKQPAVTVKDGETTLVKDTHYSLEYKDNLKAGTAKVIITGINGYNGSVAKGFTINPKSVAKTAVTISSNSIVYDGSPKRPDVIVTDGANTLVQGTDYLINSYSDNVNAGTASVLVIGKGNYTNNATKKFTITPKPIAKTTITVNSVVYDGSPKRPDVIVTDGANTLVQGTDYLINSYSDNVNAGTASVLVIGKGNYTNNATKKFTITPKPIAKTTITVNSVVYDGSPKRPDVIVTDGANTLVQGTDYLINSYSDNVNAGTASVLVIGKGNYTNNATKKFTITPKSIANMTITINSDSIVYDGTEQKPAVTVKDGSKALVMGTDYKISSYSNNINAGTAKVTVAGIGNYNNSGIKTFTIRPKPIADTTITLNPTNLSYDGKPKQPTVTLKNGITAMKQGKDYTFSYSNNVDAGQIIDGIVEDTGIVIIKGIGNFSGETRKKFAIAPKSLSKANIVLTVDLYEYDGKDKCPPFKVLLDNVQLDSDDDYRTTYSDNVNVGVGTVTITGKGNYKGTATAKFFITEPSMQFRWKVDNWQFINSDWYLGNGLYKEKINPTYQAALKKKLSLSEQKTVFWGEGSEKAWLDTTGGSCYGMSAVAFLARYGFMDFAAYQKNASTLYDLEAPSHFELSEPSNENNLSSLITYYQMLQAGDGIKQKHRNVLVRTHKKNIQEIISLLDKNAIVLVGYQYGTQKKAFAHAVIAYGYSYEKKEVYGVTYDGYIKVSDPNCSWNNIDAYIYFKDSGSDYAWSVPFEGAKSWGQTPASFNYIGASLSEINHDGYLYDTFAARIDAPVISNERHVSKVVQSGGTYMNQDDGQDDIVEDYSYIMNGIANAVFGYNLYDSDSAYEVSQRNAENIELHMDYENCDLYGYSSSGQSVIFDKKGFVSIEGDPGDYEMSMTFDYDYPTDWFYINVTGTRASDVSLLKETDGYVLSGDNLTNIQVCARNLDISASIGFGTDGKKVFIYEIDKNTIGLKVDKDNNGTYETSIKGVPILENNSYLSSENIQLGSSAAVIASAKGGKGSLQYAVYYKKISDSKWTTLQDYNDNTTVSVTPAKATDYDICVKVRDSYGNIEKKYFVLSVYNVLKNTSTLSAAQINLGSTGSVKASATGGAGSYTYAVYYKRQSQSQWAVKQNFSQNTNVSIKPETVADYDICVKVKDGNGNIEKKYFVLKVCDVLKNTATVSSAQINLGSKVSVKASATGGAGDCTYAVYYKKKSDTKWTVRQDFGENTAVSIKPAKATDYNICVKVRDSSGTVEKKYFVVKVCDVLKNTSTVSATQINLGSAVSVKASATGGAGNYTYAVYYKKNSDTNWTVKQNFDSNTAVSIKPVKAVNYDICVKVQDGSGAVAKKYFELTVE